MTERVPSPPLRIVSVQSPQSMEAHMKQDERYHTSDDIFVGIDLATRQHQVVVLDAQGCRLTSFKVPHSRPSGAARVRGALHVPSSPPRRSGTLRVRGHRAALLHESELARIDSDPRLLHRPMRYDIDLPSPVI